MREELVDKLVEESYGEPQPLVTERELARLRRVEAAAKEYRDEVEKDWYGGDQFERITRIGDSYDNLKAALEEQK